MAPYLAVFVGEQGGQIVTSLFTVEEFNARAKVPGTKWATLLNSETGMLINRYNNISPSSEKTT